MALLWHRDPIKKKLLYFDFFDCIGAGGFCFTVERFLALWAVVVDRWFACSAHNKTFWVRIPLPPLASIKHKVTLEI